MRESTKILQDVVVLGFAVRACEVHVDLYGGPSNVCASVRFTFANRFRRMQAVRVLERWRRAGAPLTLTTTASSVFLQDAAAALRTR